MTTRYVKGLEAVDDSVRGCVLTIGNFDGVHVGHRHILSTARALADAENARVVAMTFDPPPDLVLRPEDTPRRLTLADRRAELLTEAGADIVVTALTDRSVLSLSPEAFVDRIIMPHFSPKHIVEGENFFFGAERAGTVDVLRQFGQTRGYVVHVAQPVMLELDGKAQQVSSTLIRSLIAAGRVEQAATCLTRPFRVSGPIVPGRGRGRQLGFPTCNVDTGQLLVPGDGIYAGRAVIDSQTHAAAISIGSRVTFADGRRVVEVHLLDADGDFYDKELAVDFLAHVRDQERFPTAEALSEQIARDVESIRDIAAR